MRVPRKFTKLASVGRPPYGVTRRSRSFAFSQPAIQPHNNLSTHTWRLRHFLAVSIDTFGYAIVTLIQAPTIYAICAVPLANPPKSGQPGLTWHSVLNREDQCLSGLTDHLFAVSTPLLVVRERTSPLPESIMASDDEYKGMNVWAYDLLLWILSVIVDLFFREIHPRSSWKIPKKGPVLFVAAPHANQARLLLPSQRTHLG